MLSPPNWNNQVLSPPNWDNQVKYSNSILALRGAKIVECKLPLCLLDCFEIYNVNRNHPAFPGRGVRATKQIENDSVIGFYAGILRPGSWAADNPYVFGLEPIDKDFVIDAGPVGNITRFINDPRGTLYEPNLCAEDTSIATGVFSIRCVQFRTTQTILVGQEVFFAYEAGHEGYWKPPTVEVINLTESEMTIIKRERQEPKRPRDQEEEQDRNEKRCLKPPPDFIQSVDVPIEEERLFQLMAAPHCTLENNGTTLKKNSLSGWNSNTRIQMGWSDGIHVWDVTLVKNAEVSFGISREEIDFGDGYANSDKRYDIFCLTGQSVDRFNKVRSCLKRAVKNGEKLSFSLNLDAKTLTIGLNDVWQAKPVFTDIPDGEWFPYFAVCGKGCTFSVSLREDPKLTILGGSDMLN